MHGTPGLGTTNGAAPGRGAAPCVRRSGQPAAGFAALLEEVLDVDGDDEPVDDVAPLDEEVLVEDVLVVDVLLEDVELLDDAPVDDDVVDRESFR